MDPPSFCDWLKESEGPEKELTGWKDAVIIPTGNLLSFHHAARWRDGNRFLDHRYQSSLKPLTPSRCRRGSRVTSHDLTQPVFLPAKTLFLSEPNGDAFDMSPPGWGGWLKEFEPKEANPQGST